MSKKGGRRQNEKGIIIGSSFHTVFENYSKKSHTNKYLNFGAKNKTDSHISKRKLKNETFLRDFQPLCSLLYKRLSEG